MHRTIRVALGLFVSSLAAVVSIGQEGGPPLSQWSASANWHPAGNPSSLSEISQLARPERVEAVASVSLPAYAFVAITPCRQYNSLSATPLLQAVNRTVTLIGAPCNIPASAAAVSANITIFNITGASGNGVFKVDTISPPASAWINYPPSEAQRANAGTVALNATGQVIVQVAQGAGQIDFVVDVNGYYTSDLGNQNTFVGNNAGKSTTGAGNTAVGDSALMNNIAGTNNTALGEDALLNATGSHNTAIGDSAGINVMGGSNNISIGNLGGNESNTIRIGGPNQTGTFIVGISGATSAAGVGVFVNSNGQLGTTTSSARFKEDIRDMGEASDGLRNLRPVSFRYKPELDPAGLEQYGLIAEEVAKVYPDLVTRDDAGQAQTVRYHFLVPMLLNEVQKDRKTIEDQRAIVEELKARLERLEGLLSPSAR